MSPMMNLVKSVHENIVFISKGTCDSANKTYQSSYIKKYDY